MTGTRWIATLLGCGLLPGAPGTYASLAVAAGLAWCGDDIDLAAGAGLVLFSILSVRVGRHAQAVFGRHDPGPFVLDEAAGVCLAALFLPASPLAAAGTAFLLFRVFDIAKPPPARRLERLPRGWGILADDLAAGVYANLCGQALLRVLPLTGAA